MKLLQSIIAFYVISSSIFAQPDDPSDPFSPGQIPPNPNSNSTLTGASDSDHSSHTVVYLAVSLIGGITCCICLCCVIGSFCFFRSSRREDLRIYEYDDVDVDDLDYSSEDEEEEKRRRRKRRHRHHRDLDFDDYEDKAAEENLVNNEMERLGFVKKKKIVM